jgi:Uma2 family endonuclease
MAETDLHRDLMVSLIAMLRAFFAGQRVYVSGNLLVCYQRGDRRRHVAPDVFVVRGVENRQRPNYLIWEESKGPEVVIELTSQTTHEEDTETKRLLYRDVLKVQEYFLFDPNGGGSDAVTRQAAVMSRAQGGHIVLSLPLRRHAEIEGVITLEFLPTVQLSPKVMEDLVEKIVDEATSKYEREVPGDVIGKLVMEGLRGIDEVAYVRFASVYRRFQEATDFVQEVKKLEAKQ